MAGKAKDPGTRDVVRLADYLNGKINQAVSALYQARWELFPTGHETGPLVEALEKNMDSLHQLSDRVCRGEFEVPKALSAKAGGR